MGISREQALDCFESDDLVGIGMEADAVRRRRHPDGIVGYAIRVTLDCSTQSDPLAAVADLVDRGATSLRICGAGDRRSLEGLLKEISRQFPDLWIEACSVADIHALAQEAGTGLHDTFRRLMDVGLNTFADEGIRLAGADADAISAHLEVHRTAHALGMQTVAGFIFGAGESVAQRIDFLAAMRKVQEETGGIAAFAPRTAPASNGRELDGVTAVERLRTLAISRMFLDTIETVQASASPQSLKVLQMSLRFGANDLGAVAPEPGREEEVRSIVRDAGFRPVQRAMGYRAMLAM